MDVRRAGLDVALTPDGLAAAFPEATSRIAVFVHGRFETDESWRHFPLRGERAARRGYGEWLQDELSFTPMYIRYNTGLRISQSGRELARLLDDLMIKDLHYGSCVEEDWCDCDPDEFLRNRCKEVPFLPDAGYYFIGATLSEGPLGSLLGDLLVRLPSASGCGNGKGRSIPFEVDNGRELTGLTHFDLLNHPAVYEQLRSWITRAPARRPPPG
jgi:hypothetical protein